MYYLLFQDTGCLFKQNCVWTGSTDATSRGWTRIRCENMPQRIVPKYRRVCTHVRQYQVGRTLYVLVRLDRKEVFKKWNTPPGIHISIYPVTRHAYFCYSEGRDMGSCQDTGPGVCT